MTDVNAETQQYDQRKKDIRSVAIASIIAVVFVTTFLLYFGPKFLNTQFLPIDPFGVVDHSATNDAPIIGLKDSTAIKEVRVSGEYIGEVIVRADDADDGSAARPITELQVGDVIALKASISPLDAQNIALTEWSINDETLGHFDGKTQLVANFVADDIGYADVHFNAYTDTNLMSDSITLTISFSIVAQAPEDVLPPYRNDVFVTSETEAGIFVRSDVYVDGDPNTLNDGNKIAWIEGGDISVELIATGVEHHEGGDGYWWYQVTIPEWYRETEMQTQNYAGQPLVGWVRNDIVQQIR